MAAILIGAGAARPAPQSRIFGRHSLRVSSYSAQAVPSGTSMLCEASQQLAADFSSFTALTPSRTRTPTIRHLDGLRTDYQSYIHASKYARWIEQLGRRESWPETVARYFDFMEGHLLQQHAYAVPRAQRAALEAAVLSLDVMPSMRALMTAGPALQRSNIAGYNCSYLPVDDPAAFHETLYILMNGTGVGYSVERKFVEKLPPVAASFRDTSEVIVVADSRLGWSDALRQLIARLFTGEVPRWDLSAVRPAGTPLKTFGGRASGPEPLERLFVYAVALFRRAAGRQLSPLECHDLVCKLAEIVVVGGVRRSALISLSDLEDDEMRLCKSGTWWESHPERSMANVSAVYTERPSRAAFDREWAALRASGSGERGIFSRAAAVAQAAANRGRASAGVDFGTNPCSEIILRPFQFCNLTEVVVRADDTLEALERKVRLAATLGTWQATLTEWAEGDGGLRPIWRENTAEERLLGVSMTGIMDNVITSGQQPGVDLPCELARLKAAAVAQNAADAACLGITPSAAVTCVKPSGTVSQLVDAASGIHPRHSEYYVRRVRGGLDDPLTTFLEQEGVPCEPCVYNDKVKVFSFPIASPAGAIVRDDLSAIDQLKLCLDYQHHWCEHKPSVTVTVREHEWDVVGDWVYAHFDELAGVSFLPHDMGSYQQTPYEAIERDEYEHLLALVPAEIDWQRFRELERHARDDNVGLELACSSGTCEHVGEQLTKQLTEARTA